MDRLAQGLAFDVPQRLIDASDRAHVYRATAIKAAAIHDSPMILDQERVLAEQVVLHFVHQRLHRQCSAFNHGLPPSDDPLVRLNLQEEPAWRYDIGRQFPDLHGSWLSARVAL